MQNLRPHTSGKWLVIIILVLSLVASILRWVFVPKTNPREADPGTPYYSPSLPKSDDLNEHKAL